MNGVGEPCAGEPQARFDRGPLARTPQGETEHAPAPETGGTEPVRPTGHTEPAAYLTAEARFWADRGLVGVGGAGGRRFGVAWGG